MRDAHCNYGKTKVSLSVYNGQTVQEKVESDKKVYCQCRQREDETSERERENEEEEEEKK